MFVYCLCHGTKSTSELKADHANPKLSELKSYLTKLSNYLKILQKYEDEDSIKELEQRRSELLSWIHAAQNNGDQALAQSESLSSQTCPQRVPI